MIAATGRIDVLINNAGMALAGALEETSIAEAKELFEPAFTATRLVKNQREVAQRIPAYSLVRTRVLQRFAENTDHGVPPEQVAETVLEAASAESPNLRYPVNGAAKSVSRLRRFMPARMFEKTFRQQLLLDV